MSAPLTIGFDPGCDSGAAGRAHGLIASFARSFRVADGVRADVTIVDGAAGWAARSLAAVDAGAARVFIIEPVLDDIPAMRKLADRVAGASGEVVISEGYADNPGLAQFRQWLAHGFGAVALRGWGEHALRTLLLMQLRMVRAIGVHDVEFVDVLAGNDAALVIAEARSDRNAMLLRLCATRSSSAPARQTLIAHAGDATARIDVFDGATAWPAQASFATPAGLQCPPTLYESAHRARLHLLAQGQAQGAAGGLQQFIEDAEQAMSAFV